MLLGMSREGKCEGGSAAERLFAGLRSGDARALARAASLVEDRAAEAGELLALCQAAVADGERALRIGITGPPGAGKSTLMNALSREFAGRGQRVGIVAVDPSSAFTGGAILGDRIRLAETDAVYMRSMATRGHLGGLAAATRDVLTVIEASGRDVLLIETTGVGQGEIEVVRLADVVAVVLVPGMGDGVQALKAGVLEIADVYVLNKADREGIDRLEQEMQAMLGLGSATDTRPVLRTVATTGEGVAALAEALENAPRRTMPGLLSGLPLQQTPVLDHLGIAVESIEAALALYGALGVPLLGTETIAQEQVRVAMLGLGLGPRTSRIELLEPTEADSAVGRFLAKRGPGLHHIALRVKDLADVMAQLTSHGVLLVTDEIQTGAGGHRYVFIHPSSANGVLMELVEEARG